jgi:hypothetical protein
MSRLPIFGVLQVCCGTCCDPELEGPLSHPFRAPSRHRFPAAFASDRNGQTDSLVKEREQSPTTNSMQQQPMGYNAGTMAMSAQNYPGLSPVSTVGMNPIVTAGGGPMPMNSMQGVVIGPDGLPMPPMVITAPGGIVPRMNPVGPAGPVDFIPNAQPFADQDENKNENNVLRQPKALDAIGQDINKRERIKMLLASKDKILVREEE